MIPNIINKTTFIDVPPQNFLACNKKSREDEYVYISTKLSLMEITNMLMRTTGDNAIENL
jgi:hypothetical protein